jgi:hypothetical protein
MRLFSYLKIVAFDRGYYGFTHFNRFSEAGLTRVTPRRKNVVYEVLYAFPLPAKAEAVISEEHIILG